MNSPRMFTSVDVLADTDVSIGTETLAPRTYWIYAIDIYGIIAGPISVEIVEAISTVEEAGYQPKIELFPIPAYEIVTVRANIPDRYVFSITSLNGQQVLIGEMEETTHQIDLSSFQKGVYFITIRSKVFVTTRKILKF